MGMDVDNVKLYGVQEDRMGYSLDLSTLSTLSWLTTQVSARARARGALGGAAPCRWGAGR